MDDLENLLRDLGVIEFKWAFVSQKLGRNKSVALMAKMNDGSTCGFSADTLDQVFDMFTARMKEDGRWRRG